MSPVAASSLQCRRNIACAVDRDETLRYLGHVDQQLSPDLSLLIDETVRLCEDVAQPSWCYRVFPVVREGERAVLEGSALSLPLDGSLLTLAPMSACAVMACTIGLAHDREARRLSIARATEALVFDAAGSSLVEECADACERDIHAYAAAMSLHAGQRTSPGYGDLPLSLSRDIIQALDAGKHLGVSVLPSNLLVPMKSVTALVGLFEREEDACRARRSCADCVVVAQCPYLKAGKPCNNMVC